ncbi:ribokinase [Candidatus Dojkabacteria bacterium]|nr:ribokinase [Candidatus Dojkabacteria bacterium]
MARSTKSSKAPKIVVLGGLVMDLIWEVPEWPMKRKAVQATRFRMQPGGKGLNQAIAAARLGAQVGVISAVGVDHLGDLLLTELEQMAVDCQFVDRDKAAGTDATGVIVEKGDPGFIGGKIAGQTVGSKLIHKAENYIKRADVLMATCEIKVETILTAFEIAKKYKVTTILNPAPPEKLSSELLALTDYLVPNEWEASVVAGVDQGGFLSVERIAKRLKQAKAQNIIITAGDLGGVAYLADGGIKKFQSYEVEQVDATGASDAFCAAFAVSLAQDKSVEESITIASASGALACLKFGASTSMPLRNAVNSFLKRNHKNIVLD